MFMGHFPGISWFNLKDFSRSASLSPFGMVHHFTISCLVWAPPMILTIFHDLRIKSPQLEPSNSSLGVERWGLIYKELSWFKTPKTTETMVDTSNFVELHRSTKFINCEIHQQTSSNIHQTQPLNMTFGFQAPAPARPMDGWKAFRPCGS